MSIVDDYTPHDLCPMPMVSANVYHTPYDKKQKIKVWKVCGGWTCSDSNFHAVNWSGPPGNHALALILTCKHFRK